MYRRPKIADKVGMINATTQSAEIMGKAIEFADALRIDPHKASRLMDHECKPCYYRRHIYGRMAGQATTTTECSLCHDQMTFSDTAIDAYCAPCADRYSMCIHCGGDIDCRPRRRKWPDVKRVARKIDAAKP